MVRCSIEPFDGIVNYPEPPVGLMTLERAWRQLSEARVHLERAQDVVQKIDVVEVARATRGSEDFHRSLLARSLVDLEGAVNRAVGDLKTACVQLAELAPPTVLEDPDVDPADDVEP